MLTYQGQSLPPTSFPASPACGSSHALPDSPVGTPTDKPSVALELVPRRHARRLSVPYKSLLLTLVVFTLTSGLGIAVLAWLFVRRRMPVSEAFQTGYILVDEGVKRWEGTMDSATLRALTATSFISTLMAITSPILMTLIGYRIAYLWMTEQAVSDNGPNIGPTPLQYGLLIQVLGASNITSLFNSVRYLIRRKSRPWAPHYFKIAVVLGVMVYVVTHLVGLADLWLHATTSAVFNQSLCDPWDGSGDLGTICITESDGWAIADGEELLEPIGQAVIANYSVDRRVITLADSEDMSVVVPRAIPQLATFKATSFGALARCTSLNSHCDGGGAEEIPNPLNCSRLGITAIPTDTDVSSIALVAPFDEWNGTRITADFLKYGPHWCCLTNPIQSLLQLRWSNYIDSAVSSPNPAVHAGPIGYFNIYASCELTFYNVTMAFDGQAPNDKYWSIIPNETTPSNEAFASTLAGPFSWQLVTDNLAANIKSRAMSTNSTQAVMAALNQELSRLSLGIVSGAFEFVPATDVKIITPTILGRYPLVPLLIFVSLLLIYGLMALGFFVMSLSAKSDVILLPPESREDTGNGGNGKSILSLELAQLRLLSPLPVVAQHFAEPIYPLNPPHPGDADWKSAARSGMDLFAEDNPSSQAEARLRLGIEDTMLRPRFGVWKHK